jgi:hypothetical protein
LSKEKPEAGDIKFAYQIVRKAEFVLRHNALFVDTIIGSGAIISPATKEDEKKFPPGTKILLCMKYTLSFGGGWARAGIAKVLPFSGGYTDILVEGDLRDDWRLPGEGDTIEDETFCKPKCGSPDT